MPLYLGYHWPGFSQKAIGRNLRGGRDDTQFVVSNVKLDNSLDHQRSLKEAAFGCTLGVFDSVAKSWDTSPKKN